MFKMDRVKNRMIKLDSEFHASNKKLHLPTATNQVPEERHNIATSYLYKRLRHTVSDRGELWELGFNKT